MLYFSSTCQQDIFTNQQSLIHFLQEFFFTIALQMLKHNKKRLNHIKSCLSGNINRMEIIVIPQKYNI